MDKWSIFDESTGEYIGTHETTGGVLWDIEGQVIVENLDANPFTHWYHNGEAREYTPQEKANKLNAQQFKKWNNLTMSWVDHIPVSTAKEIKLQWVNEKRTDADNEGFVFNGDTFDLSFAGQMKIQAITTMINANPQMLNNPNYDINIVLIDKSSKAMRARDVVDVCSALVNHIDFLDEKAQTLRSHIAACTTIDQLNALVW